MPSVPLDNKHTSLYSLCVTRSLGGGCRGIIYIYTGWFKKNARSYLFKFFLLPGINIDLLYINRKVFRRPIAWTNPLLKTPYIFRDNYNKLVKFHPKTNTLYDGCTEYFRMKSGYIHSAWSPLLSARQWALCVLYFVHLSTFEKIMFWRKMDNSG